MTKYSRAYNVRFHEDMLIVILEDRREIRVPLTWFPKLNGATSMEQGNWRLLGDGAGIRWPDLDEDLSVHALLNPYD